MRLLLTAATLQNVISSPIPFESGSSRVELVPKFQVATTDHFWMDSLRSSLYPRVTTPPSPSVRRRCLQICGQTASVYLGMKLGRLKVEQAMNEKQYALISRSRLVPTRMTTYFNKRGPHYIVDLSLSLHDQ